MKEGLKKPLRAFAVVSLVELILVLVVGTAAWAIAKHDFASLDRSFFDGMRTELYAKIVGVLVALIAGANLVGVAVTLIKGEKPIAFAMLVMAGAIASLFFLPMRFTVFGLGGLGALFVSLKLAHALWRAVSWPFRKLFGRKPKAADASAPSQAAPKAKTS